ncbi:hypothetical protein PG990_001904 [Apiospora arundinis]
MAVPGRAPPTTGLGRITNGYTVEEGRFLTESQDATLVPHLYCALDFIARFLRDKGLGYAVMGGLALILRGSRRETHDVDIVAACDMLTLRQACIGQSRIKVPIGPVSGVMRVFVEVGPAYGENVTRQWVQVDIILRGSLGAPADLTGATDIISLPTTAGLKRYIVIDILHHFKSKLGALFGRNSTTDFLDLVFMCNMYFQQIAGFRNQLNFPQREHFIRHYAAGIRDPSQLNRVKKIKQLLGVP